MPRKAPEKRFAILILAAGKGTRLKSRRPKVLHEIAGMPLLQHVIQAAAQVTSTDDIYAIIGHEAEQVKRAVAETGVGFILQPEQRGTGHAIMCARNVISRYDYFLVLSGDVPLIRPDTITRVRDSHLKARAAMTILTAEPPDPTGYGRIVRKSAKSDEVTAIVEQKALTKAQMKAREINSGIYAFSAAPLLKHIDSLSTKNAHGEFYLTDMAAILRKHKQKVIAVRAADHSEVLGANTLAELAELDAALRMQKARELMASGVTILRPDTCVIDAIVSVQPDTIIEPFVQLLGNTTVGSDCRVRSYSVIFNSHIGNSVLIRPGCIIDQAEVRADAMIGPYAHLRPGSHIGERAHVGNFVETKKTRMGRGAKANHLTYLGDATIGDHVNVGAGTITCNYDGVNKTETIIEEGAFIGSDSTLVAPIRIGKGAYVAAGSSITEDVPADALAIARTRQTVKPGWASRRRAAKSAR